MSDRIKVEVTSYGPSGKDTLCIIVRQGEDKEPTCVNPQCPKLDNCRRHATNREETTQSPTIAIITWRDCTWYQPIDPDKYK